MSEESFVRRENITRAPTHPGVLFARDILPELGRRTIGEITTLLGVSRQTLHRVMAGDTAISPEMAVRLSIAFDTSAESWLQQQVQYDLWQAERQRKTLRVGRLAAA